MAVPSCMVARQTRFEKRLLRIEGSKSVRDVSRMIGRFLSGYSISPGLLLS